MKIKFLPEEERPVEKCMSYGIESLSNRELLALLINSGTREQSAMELAEVILAKEQAGITYLREASIEELMSIKGIGKAKAARLAAAVELGKRLATKPVKSRSYIESYEDVASLFMEDLRYQNKEYFKALLLNSKCGIISVETISIGELNSTIVHPREVFNAAVKKKCCGNNIRT